MKARHLKPLFVWLALAGGAALFVTPMLWMFLVSVLPDHRSVMQVEPWSWRSWDVRSFEWGNYERALRSQPFHRYAWNSLVVASLGVVGEVLSCSLIAYPFARLRFPGRNVLFIVILATLMLPPQVTMVPLFILFRSFGWIDTVKPLIVPAFFGNAFGIFLFRQYFMTIPLSQDEAAAVDGCSPLRTYWSILLPQSVPVIATVAVLGFINRWNDFLTPLIYLSSREKFTLALGLASFQGQHATSWNLMMAASLVVMVPSIVLFVMAQRYLLSGFALGADKD